MDNKSKKLLKLGTYVYGKKIQILLLDTDKLLFLKKYKNVNNVIKRTSLKDKRIQRFIVALLRYKLSFTMEVYERYYFKNPKKLKWEAFKREYLASREAYYRREYEPHD